jgi:hypothetical protein
MLSRTRNRVAGICAVALGSGALALGAAGAFDAAPAVAHHHHHHHCIPQNNGGDHDSDNNGGPSDGDGCT